MTEPLRIDQLTRAEIAGIQARLAAAGFDPGAQDGVWGPCTAQAYTDYVATSQRPSVEVGPAPARPWWESRAVLGALVAIFAGVVGLAGWEVDRAQLTEIIIQVVALGGAIVSWWGSVKRKGPIDPTAVLPGVRLPSRVSPAPLPTNTQQFEKRGAADHDPLGHFRSD